MKKKTKVILDVILLIAVISWIVFLFRYGPEEIINKIGIHNGYLLAFASAFLGGLATVSAVSVYPVIVAFAIGGLDPFILGILAAFGLTFANLVFFYLGLKGYYVARTSSKFQKISTNIIGWINRRPRWLTPILIWAYIGLSPFPNNLLTTSGGLINYPFKKLIIPLFLGNITLMTILSYFSIVGVEIFK